LFKTILICSVDIAACAPDLAKPSAQLEYINCLKRVSKETGDGDCIPKSKAALCEILLPATECLPKWLESTCADSENLRKYRVDYYAANERPCKAKEEYNKYMSKNSILKCGIGSMLEPDIIF
ncbi:unnamed protein product, partial [Callosobruchus maculatus]